MGQVIAFRRRPLCYADPFTLGLTMMLSWGAVMVAGSVLMLRSFEPR